LQLNLLNLHNSSAVFSLQAQSGDFDLKRKLSHCRRSFKKIIIITLQFYDL